MCVLKPVYCNRPRPKLELPWQCQTQKEEEKHEKHDNNGIVNMKKKLY